LNRKYRFKVDKLIRDKTPAILGKIDISLFERILEQDEYRARLKDKLLEEASEVFEAKTIVDIQEELADVLEVIHALSLAHGLSYEQVEEARVQKKQARGGFADRIYSPFFEMDTDNEDVAYYLSQPDRYPEIT